MADLVVDASALVETLLRSPAAPEVDDALLTSDPVAPDVLDAEVLTTLFKLERRQAIDSWVATQAMEALRTAPVDRIPVPLLAPLAFSLRTRLSAVDALYVALARRLGCPLLTADGRLGRLKGLGIPVLLVGG